MKTTIMAPSDREMKMASFVIIRPIRGKHDVDAGVEDRPAGSVAGYSDGLELGPSSLPLAAEAADDEQGVVYADRHSPQEDHLAVRIGKRIGQADDGGYRGSDEDRPDGRDQGHDRRDHRTEGDQQDDQPQNQRDHHDAGEILLQKVGGLLHDRGLAAYGYLEAIGLRCGRVDHIQYRVYLLVRVIGVTLDHDLGHHDALVARYHSGGVGIVVADDRVHLGQSSQLLYKSFNRGAK